MRVGELLDQVRQYYVDRFIKSRDELLAEQNSENSHSSATDRRDYLPCILEQAISGHNEQRGKHN